MKRQFESKSLSVKMQLNLNDFEGQRLKNTGPIAVLFQAEWCPFCRQFTPIFESYLSQAKLPFAIVDLSDLSNPLWEVFEIDVVPSVLLFNGGRLIQRNDGVLGQGLKEPAIGEIISKLKSLDT